MKKLLIIIGAAVILIAGLLLTLVNPPGAATANGYYNMSTLKSSVQPTLSMFSQFAAGATVESCSLTRYRTTVQGSPGRLAVCVVGEDGPTLTIAEVVYDNGNEFESAPDPYATGSAALSP